MASNYPGGLDSFDTIASDKKTSDAVGGRTHRQMHNDLGDAIEAVQAELGTDPAGASATVKARFEVIEANDWVTSARIAADAVGSSEIAANAVGASELADNAVDTAAIADSAVTSAKIANGTIVAADVAAEQFAAFGTVGNLLTSNQASGTDTLGDTTGFVGANDAVLSRTTSYAHTGTGCLRMVTARTTPNTRTGTERGSNSTPVVAGEPISATARLRTAVGSRTVMLSILFYNGDTYVSQVNSPQATPSSGSFDLVNVVTTVPAGANRANVEVAMTNSGSLNDEVLIDSLGLWKGAAGVWSAPGVPVVGQSHIASNGAVHLSGTGTPEGVITAAPGSTWLQTDATTDVKGWLRWVKATGTGNTGWVAGADADTGWRDLAAEALSNGWTVNNSQFRLRRVGAMVYLNMRADKSAASGDTIYTLPSGFRPSGVSHYSMCDAGTLTTYVTTAGAVQVVRTSITSGNITYLSMSWPTTDAWPASLPGAAA